MDDTDENFSQTELQLLSQNNHLKQRIKEIEELYTAEDEKSYQEIQRLKSGIKELEEKIENLQTRIYDAENFSPPPSSSLSLHSSALESEHNTSATNNSSFDNSLLEDYLNLQGSFQTLSAEKAEAVAKVAKLSEQLKTLQETIEDLISKKNTREEYVQRLESAYNEVFQNYEELYKANGLLQKEIDDLQLCNRFSESPMSLFDELEEIRSEESQSTEEEGEEEVVSTKVIESHEDSLPEILENSFQSKPAIKERRKLISNDNAVNKSWISQSFAIFVLTMLFIIIYSTVCIQLDKPVFWFVSSKYFNTRLVTVQMPPM